MTYRRVIARLGVGEEVPAGAVEYSLPVAGVSVIDVITDESFSTTGTILFDSTEVTPAVKDEDGNITTPRVIAQSLSEDFIHQFSGWENNT